MKKRNIVFIFIIVVLIIVGVFALIIINNLNNPRPVPIPHQLECFQSNIEISNVTEISEGEYKINIYRTQEGVEMGGFKLIIERDLSEEPVIKDFPGNIPGLTTKEVIVGDINFKVKEIRATQYLIVDGEEILCGSISRFEIN